MRIGGGCGGLLLLNVGMMTMLFDKEDVIDNFYKNILCKKTNKLFV